VIHHLVADQEDGLAVGYRLAAHKWDNVQGDMVQDLHSAGQLDRINDYCRCDVLDTYFVFLRVNVMVGRIDLIREQELIHETRQWLEASVDEFPIYGAYLEQWGDWENPWIEDESPTVTSTD